MATIVKFYKDGKNVKDITSIGYLPVDEAAVKDSRHLASSGSVIAAAALGEESMMANLPIADSTLRFLFGDLSYDPTVAGVGSSGTWTKKNTKFTNVWDWTNENTSWASAFYISGNDGAFMDYDNNPVKVIAAGDTSSVTVFSRCFSWCTAITEICPINTSNATDVFLMFNQLHNCTKFPDMDFSSATDVRGVFQFCFKMLSAPNIIFPTDNSFSIANLFFGCKNLETVPLYNLEQCTNTASMFHAENLSSFMPLKSVPKFNTSNVTSMEFMFSGCKDLTTVPEFDTSKVTDMHNMFYKCAALTEIPALNHSKVTRYDDFANGCTSLTEIPEMNIEANVTRCSNMFKNCPNIKSGQKALYDKLSAINTITNHADCFKNCGSATEEGRAELAQIPVSWGGTLEENP